MLPPHPKKTVRGLWKQKSKKSAEIGLKSLSKMTRPVYPTS